jgi:hypothetical protein
MTALEEKPVKEVLVSLHTISYLFALTAVAAAIAWIYFVAKAVENKEIGGSDGEGVPVNTATVMFEGAVVGILLYMVFRHHFSQSHA